MRKKLIIIILGLFIVILVSPSNTQEVIIEDEATNKTSLIALLIAEKISIDSITKEEVREEANEVSPGDVIEYIFYIENPGRLTAYYLEPTIPVPSNTNLIVDSIVPNKYLVSVDGNNFIDFPVYDKNKEEVPSSAYKKVRWFIESLETKEKVNVRLRVRVDS